MKIEDEARQSVSSEKITRVILLGDIEYAVAEGSFAAYSPTEPDPRRGVRPGVFVRFRVQSTHDWIEAPLGSLVAWGYSNGPDNSDHEAVGS